MRGKAKVREKQADIRKGLVSVRKAFCDLPSSFSFHLPLGYPRLSFFSTWGFVREEKRAKEKREIDRQGGVRARRFPLFLLLLFSCVISRLFAPLPQHPFLSPFELLLFSFYKYTHTYYILSLTLGTRVCIWKCACSAFFTLLSSFALLPFFPSLLRVFRSPHSQCLNEKGLKSLVINNRKTALPPSTYIFFPLSFSTRSHLVSLPFAYLRVLLFLQLENSTLPR